ncbi:MAG: hypothetical protein QXP80_03920 [Zestosphaera sp.]
MVGSVIYYGAIINEKESAISSLKSQVSTLELEKTTLFNQASEKDETIESLNSQVTQLREWLEGNKTLLQQALATISSLQTQVNQLRSQMDQLQKNYTSLRGEYDELLERFEPLEEARRILKDFADYVSTSDLFNYVRGTYQKALGSDALYLLWYSPQTPYNISLGHFTYVIETPLYTGEIVVDWNITGSNYYVMVMEVNELLHFYSDKQYHVINSSFGDVKKPLHISADTGQMLAFVIWNSKSSNVRVYDWRIYEKVGVHTPEDLRKVYAVHYYIATNVPYVYDVEEEVKPPLRTLSEGGDCEDKAILAASTLLSLGYSPDRVALALIDTNGDGIGDHAVSLAQLPPDYDISYLAYDLARLTILFTSKDPYEGLPPNIMLVPANIVNRSAGKGYFIAIDPPDLTKGEIIEQGLIPGNINFSNYNILYAETIESLLTK